MSQPPKTRHAPLPSARASDVAVDEYHDDYESEPIGGDNPYWRCVHCKISAPAINGRLQGHSSSCRYRQAQEFAKRQMAVGVDSRHKPGSA